MSRDGSSPASGEPRCAALQAKHSMHGVGHRTHGEMDGGALCLQAAKSSVHFTVGYVPALQ